MSTAPVSKMWHVEFVTTSRELLTILDQLADRKIGNLVTRPVREAPPGNGAEAQAPVAEGKVTRITLARSLLEAGDIIDIDAVRGAFVKAGFASPHAPAQAFAQLTADKEAVRVSRGHYKLKR